MTMMFNAQWAMDQPTDLNLVSRLWKKLSSNVLLCAQLFEFTKVAKLAMVQIMGFVEDERTFSTLTFVKTRLWNRLCEHFESSDSDVCITFLYIDIFPSNDAIIAWTE